MQLPSGEPSFREGLVQLLCGKLGHPWVQENVFSGNQAHPIARWIRPVGDGYFEANTSLMQLAYDCFLVREYGQLLDGFCARLKRPEMFQGARFELAAAAIVAVAGGRALEAPDAKVGKIPEFYFSFEGTRLAAECKSRHAPDAPLKLQGLLNKGLKQLAEPTILFLEPCVAASYAPDNAQSVARDAVRRSAEEGRFGNCALVVVLNDSGPRKADSELFLEVNYWGQMFTGNRNSLPTDMFYRLREAIHRAVRRRTDVPGSPPDVSK